MGFYLKKNNAVSKVATVGGIDNSTDPVTFAVTTGEGTKFPASNFLITIDNEILLCTSRTGDNLTCARAKESTTIAAHSQNADVENRITAGTLAEYELLLLGMPRGTMLNGKIVPSVANNDLTVAIKGLDGNDPSATNPVYVRIGDTVRSITAALSVTKADGTNWFNHGAAEFAAQEADYFVYLGYNATDGVVIGFSPIPYACEYNDFSVTTTNELYCAISTITNAAAGDDYEVVGRFAATLSAGAGYTWTVPTFTNKNLIQFPIRNTRWLSLVPVLAWTAGTAPTGSPTSLYVKYKIDDRDVQMIGLGRVYTAGATVTRLDVTGPFSGLSPFHTADAFVGVENNVNGCIGVFNYNTAKVLTIYCTSVSATYWSCNFTFMI